MKERNIMVFDIPIEVLEATNRIISNLTEGLPVGSESDIELVYRFLHSQDLQAQIDKNNQMEKLRKDLFSESKP